MVSKKLIVTGAGVYVAGTATAYALLRPTPCDGHLAETATFDDLANSYDSKVNFEEMFMGLKLLRRWLVRQAQGDVLEISAGTGRNLPYYRADRLTSLTLTDNSKHMLFHAQQKCGSLCSSDKPVSFRAADAASITLLCPDNDVSSGVSSASNSRDGSKSSPASAAAQPPGCGKYHTIVDTFGLCSHADPVAVLQEAGRACRPGGRILLLEHGRASYDWLNDILDRDADKHRRSWACTWNLPILEIVKRAGLHIESVSRWHFGTTYLIVCTPAVASKNEPD